jgi:uncharacterized membrane protein YdbT with pleckstrin-like domain
MLFFSSAAHAAEMADIMRQDGKIYVVVAVISMVFLVIVVYLISQELRIRRIEKKLQK